MPTARKKALFKKAKDKKERNQGTSQHTSGGRRRENHSPDECNGCGDCGNTGCLVGCCCVVALCVVVGVIVCVVMFAGVTGGDDEDPADAPFRNTAGIQPTTALITTLRTTTRAPNPPTRSRSMPDTPQVNDAGYKVYTAQVTIPETCAELGEDGLKSMQLSFTEKAEAGSAAKFFVEVTVTCGESGGGRRARRSGAVIAARHVYREGVPTADLDTDIAASKDAIVAYTPQGGAERMAALDGVGKVIVEDKTDDAGAKTTAWWETDKTTRKRDVTLKTKPSTIITPSPSKRTVPPKSTPSTRTTTTRTRTRTRTTTTTTTRQVTPASAPPSTTLTTATTQRQATPSAGATPPSTAPLTASTAAEAATTIARSTAATRSTRTDTLALVSNTTTRNTAAVPSSSGTQANGASPLGTNAASATPSATPSGAATTAAFTVSGVPQSTKAPAYNATAARTVSGAESEEAAATPDSDDGMGLLLPIIGVRYCMLHVADARLIGTRRFTSYAHTHTHLSTHASLRISYIVKCIITAALCEHQVCPLSLLRRVFATGVVDIVLRISFWNCPWWCLACGCFTHVCVVCCVFCAGCGWYAGLCCRGCDDRLEAQEQP